MRANIDAVIGTQI